MEETEVIEWSPFEVEDEAEAEIPHVLPIRLPDWLRLRRAVESLSASTWVSISTLWGSVALVGRASPFKSHVSVAFSQATPVAISPATVLMYNDKHAIVINPAGTEYPLPTLRDSKGRFVARWQPMRIPEPAVHSLIKEAREYYPVPGDDRPSVDLIDILLAVPILVGWERQEQERDGSFRYAPVFERPVDDEPTSDEQA